MNLKYKIKFLPILFLLEIGINQVPAAPPKAARPCWSGDVRSNSCVESLMISRGWGPNDTLSNIAVAERLLAAGRIPNSGGSLNVAVGCLQYVNHLPYESDCSACGFMCVTTLKALVDLCALYCPNPPSIPTRSTTFISQSTQKIMTDALRLVVSGDDTDKYYKQLDANSSANDSAPLINSIAEEANVPDRSIGILVGAVIIGLVTIAGVVVLVFAFWWRHYKGDPASSRRTAGTANNRSVIAVKEEEELIDQTMLQAPSKHQSGQEAPNAAAAVSVLLKNDNRPANKEQITKV